MHRPFAFMFTAVVALTPLNAHAASLDQRIKDCLNLEPSTEMAEKLILDLYTLTRTFSSYVENNADQCFTKLTGLKSKFENGQGLSIGDANSPESQNFIKEIELKLSKEKLEKKKKDAAAAAEREKLSALQAEKKKQMRLREEKITQLIEEAKRDSRNLRCETLELLEDANKKLEEYKRASASLKRKAYSKTIDECNLWVKTERRAAMTNDVCSKIFLETGLPEDIEELGSRDIIINGLMAEIQKREFNEVLENLKATAYIFEDDPVSKQITRLIFGNIVDAKTETENESISEAYDACEARWDLWLSQN